MSSEPLPDFTAILVPAGQHDPTSIRRAVLAGGYGDAWLRARPIAALGVIAVELFDAAGAPRADAALVAALSQGGRAAFIHRSAGAGQAIMHLFAGGREVEPLWQGKPEELDDKAAAALGQTVSAIAAVDDSARPHPAFAGTGTIALVRGRPLGVPTGTPLQLGSFGFHDRNPGAAGGEAPAPGGDSGSDRVALVAFDIEAVRSSWQTVSGRELAARLASLPDHVLGPLGRVKAKVVAALDALGEETAEASDLRDVHAMELLVLSESYVFGGGESVAYLDERVLPMFSLASHEPPLDSPDEAAELEARESVLAAMVETLPYKSPEGSVLQGLEDGEARPLAPWARAGEEYVGSILTLQGERVRGLLSSVDQRDVAGWVDRFYRGWWKAQTDDPWGAEFEAWRQRLDVRGGPDVQRFLLDWAEWRTVLEMAALNQLQPALVFYG